MPLFSYEVPTVDEIAEITARDWGAQSHLRLQLATVLRWSTVPDDGSAGRNFAAMVSDEQWLLKRIRYHVRIGGAAVMVDDALAHMDAARDFMRELDGVRRRIRYWRACVDVDTAARKKSA